MRVASLHIYPLKGARAVDLARVRIGARGLDGDRRWLAVDARAKFISQRSHPRLATVAAKPTPIGLALAAPGLPALEVARPSGERRIDVAVWSSIVNAALADDAANAWLARCLGEELRLVHMDKSAHRLKIAPEWMPEPAPISFADAYPVLVATTGSLGALNDEIGRAGGRPVPMRRFRPNIVVECDDPWAEDTWAALKIGPIVFDLVKPADRCLVTTTDQETGQRMGKEPLASLARIRRSADARLNGVLFAWNAVPAGAGEIAVGDGVEIVRRRPEGFALHPPAPGEREADALVEGLVTNS